MNKREEIRKFIEKLLRRRGDHGPIGDEDSLFMSGRLESIDAVEIVMFLEENFNVNFADTGFDEAEVDSVKLIENFIHSHTRT